MKLIVKARHMNLTPALKAHAEQKLGDAIKKIFDGVEEIGVEGLHAGCVDPRGIVGRGDEIEVMSTQFAGLESEEEQLDQIRQWEMYSNMARSSSLGIAAIVVLLVGLLTIYRLRPVTIRVDSTDERARRRERSMAELSARVKQNPEMVKAVISAWLDGEDASSVEANDRKRAA